MCWIDPQAHTYIYLIPSIFGVAHVCRYLVIIYLESSHVPKTPILYWDGRQKETAACKEQHLGDGASTRTQTPAAFVTAIDSATYWDCILGVEDLENLPSPSKSTARKPILDLFASQKNFEFQFEYS